ncbi:Protein of unknown function [Bacillus cytotoxicus]|uniref:Uncharacterized protein n=1 Tax=Bacillus cytotoxicus TaxID=580165 RepID=A0AAX2CGR6_9BACI|nr:Protein of unknown function [Bacillus cytotoxicus]
MNLLEQYIKEWISE